MTVLRGTWTRGELRQTLLLLLVVLILLMVTGCVPATESQSSKQLELYEEAAANAANAYVPKNDLEFNNYNRRQQIADDPTTLLWCTFFPVTVGQEPFTVPIVGKLTSSGKRPFPETIVKQFEYHGSYFPELVQPDKMYGSSSEYRFGFTPADFYIDFTDLASFCTTEPTTWQQNQTHLIMEPASGWKDLQSQAQQALKDGNFDEAIQILGEGLWHESTGE